ncbi:hypothetical protein ACFFWB_11215 [Flavobacterium procerum]|uniref:hypothetical protein n=1 Tax=Flavobacterium procerum TaxID=1455569 RepID=UPI0035E996C8
MIFLSLQSCAQKTDKLKSEKLYHSEKIKDSIFENVIEITGRNIESNGIDYLFNVSISKNIKTPILFISERVPLKLLPTIYPEFSKLIVVVPNWTYYDEVSQNQPKGGCAEPMASSIIYEFNSENGKLQKDSLVIMGGFPEMKMAKRTTLSNTEIEIFYTESYGSSCCPKDLQWDNKPTREEFIDYFEKENNVKIKNTYYESRGKEGEAIFYYPLKELPNNLILKFILERDFYRIINRHTKDIIKIPKIYTPSVIDISSNRIKKI